MLFKTRLLSLYYNDYYLPLGTHPTKRPSVRAVFVACVLVASLVVNLVVLIKHYNRFISPLDMYQELKDYPLVDADAAHSMALPEAHGENAIVTTLYSDAYAPAVAALGHSIRRTNTTVTRLIVLYLPSQVSPRALCVASSSGFVPHAVERIAPPHNGSGITPRFGDQYTKLALWSLDTLAPPVRALVYIDADCLALRPFDELFALPYALAAVPDVYGDARGFTTSVNAGVLVVRPDSRLFAAMLRALPAARFPPAMAEQAFLNQFFATDVLRLPYAYNGNLALKARSPRVWDGIRGEMRVMHYTLVKPFVSRTWGAVPLERLPERVAEAAEEKKGLFREEMTLWGRTWEETSVVYARSIDQCRSLRDSAESR
ncbi:glycosyltransferase family 8 protein [Phlebiopsis gigantea 11061_1 CR5-6]|uniref:Glycosyltransferase family 8 protein n=1 Tax=Phlebiopsis gigantea (strain 11061_1 CR5-6) TaxID=745531 RepID=A0A0C3PRB3_PHLG1|nr:glycosyltransferase family 8 protein [Phlebiopsis gigantea 11061_1 CR5-6]